MPDDRVTSFRPAVVAPTYNNARTLAEVLAGLESLALPMFVVNDGSTDATADLLRAWAAASGAGERIVICFPENRGKAAALQAGFAAALSRGFTHALSIDTDGQHAIHDAPALLQLAQQEPAALLVGRRPVRSRDYPLGSRIGRALSNLCIRLESGLPIGDSQCGLRIYPLQALASLRSRADRYGYETEILTRAAWAGIPIREAPITCIYHTGNARISHFRPVKDSLRAMRMHAGLLAASLAPSRTPKRLLRWLNPTTMWRDIRQGRGDGRFPSSVGAGMFMAVIPLYGIKTILCLLIAKVFRLQPLVVLAVSSLNTPPTGPVFVALSILTGSALLHGHVPGLGEFNPYRDGFTFRAIAAEWAVGSLIVGGVLALTTYWLARASVRWAAKPAR